MGNRTGKSTSIQEEGGFFDRGADRDFLESSHPYTRHALEVHAWSNVKDSFQFGTKLRAISS